jgi:hypothetical protein
MRTPPQLPQHSESNENLDSSLIGLLRDVDSYISELNEENSNTSTPTRTHSLQQPQRQPTQVAYRSNTTHRPYVSTYLLVFKIMFINH